MTTMSSWFVKPETTVLPLSNGATVTVRRRLNAGEARARVERWTKTDDVTGLLQPIHTRAGLATVTAYVVDWTVADDDGVVVPVRGLAPADLEAVIDNLLPERFAELLTAVEHHEVAMAAERTAQKKTVGPTTSEPILPSHADAVGATSG
jgi:hypothetical protein